MKANGILKRINFNCDRDTKIAVATTTYILTPDNKILLMRQTKPHRVVGDNYVGIGGKAQFKNFSQEKIPVIDYKRTRKKGKHLILKTTMLDTAVREVQEETGLKLHKKRLRDIGRYMIRLNNNKSNELWFVYNYLYRAVGNEGKLINCDEGNLELISVDKIKELEMLLHDKIMLQEALRHPDLKKQLFIETVQDDFKRNYPLRLKKKGKEGSLYIYLQDAKKISGAQGVILQNGRESIVSQAKVNEFFENYRAPKER